MTSRRLRVGSGVLAALLGVGAFILWSRHDTPERAFAEFDLAMREGRYEEAAERVSQRELQIIWGSRPQFVKFCRCVLPEPRHLKTMIAKVEPRVETKDDQIELYNPDAGRKVLLSDSRRVSTAMVWRDPEGKWGVSAQPYVHFALGISIRRKDYYRKLYDGLVAAGIPNYVHDGVLNAEFAPREELLRVADGSIPYIDEVVKPIPEPIPIEAATR